MSNVTIWRQGVNNMRLEYYIEIVCYAMQKLIVIIIIKRQCFPTINTKNTRNKNSHCPFNNLQIIYKL